MNPNTPFSPYDSDTPPVTPTQENAAQQPPDSPYMQQNSPTPAQAAPQATVQPQPNWPAYMYENPAGYRPAQPQYPGGGSGPQPSYGLSYAAAEAPQYRSSTSKLKDMVIAVIALLIVGGGTTFALLSMQKEPTPDQAFKASLDHALSTSSYTQVSTQKIGELSFEATQKANLQNIKDARISANAKLKTSDLGLDFDGYGTFKKSYFKINKADGEPPLDKSLLGKWVVVDTSGGDASLADSLSIMQDVYDPNYAMLGDYIFGNFTPTQREELEKYVLGSKLYSYDPAKVTKSKRDGQAVYVYKVKTDGKKLLDYNKKVAAMMGIGADKLDTVTMFLDTQEVAMEVSIKDEQLVHVTLDAGSVTYSGWNTTTLPQEPKPDLTFKQFNDAADAGISQPTNVSQPSSHSSSSQEADDTERETDINSLKAQIEMVYANYGYYPTLAQINNAGWRSTHMALLQADSLQDPSGKNSTLKASPAKGSYAYEVTAADGLSTCDNVKTYCDDYVLTAVLSDGTPYSQKSLNSDMYGGSAFSE